MSIICGNCSAELEDGAKFCGVCGSKIETEDIPEAYENSEADYQENELSYEEQPSYEEYADAEALQESYEEQPEAEDCSYDDIESEPTVIMDQPAYYYAPQPEQTAVPEPVPVPQTAVQPEPEPVPAAPQPAPAMKKEPAEKPASKKDKAVQTSQPSSDNGNVKVTVNVEVPSEAKTSAPLTKKDLKLQKQQMKLNEKAANAANAATAMNAAVNAAMLQNMGLIKPASRKITFGGVMAAIVFSLFLIVNVALVLGLSVGYGVSKSDLNNFNLVIGSQKFSLKNLGESAEFLEEGGTRELLESIVKSEDGFEVEINGATYDVNLSKEMISAIEGFVLSEGGMEKTVTNTLNSYMKYVSIAILCVIAYVAVTVIVLISSIISSLAGKRRAFVVPGILLVIMGLAAFAFSVIGAMSNDIPGIAKYVEDLFKLEQVAKSAIIASAAVSLVGAFLTAIGAVGKKS